MTTITRERPTDAPSKDKEPQTFCHLFIPQSSGASLCGVPRSEQPKHGYPSMHWYYEKVCSSCGLPRCPVCARGEWGGPV